MNPRLLSSLWADLDEKLLYIPAMSIEDTNIAAPKIQEYIKINVLFGSKCYNLCARQP